jgi:hypothetical protein
LVARAIWARRGSHPRQGDARPRQRVCQRHDGRRKAGKFSGCGGIVGPDRDVEFRATDAHAIQEFTEEAESAPDDAQARYPYAPTFLSFLQLLGRGGLLAPHFPPHPDEAEKPTNSEPKARARAQIKLRHHIDRHGEHCTGEPDQPQHGPKQALEHAVSPER